MTAGSYVTPASTSEGLSTDLRFFPQVWIPLWITLWRSMGRAGRGVCGGCRLCDVRGVRALKDPRHFHWVETPNPAAMNPKPTTMFQLFSWSMGSLPSVT